MGANAETDQTHGKPRASIHELAFDQFRLEMSLWTKRIQSWGDFQKITGLLAVARFPGTTAE